MIKKHILIIAIAMLTIVSGKLNATSFAAGDLTYECLGGNDYKVTFVLINDCSGDPPPTSFQLKLTCGSNSLFNFN